MTQKKYSVVIADTSCFILLDKINQLSLLQKVFGGVTTTHTIAAEFGKPLPDWITTESPVFSEKVLMDILAEANET